MAGDGAMSRSPPPESILYDNKFSVFVCKNKQQLLTKNNVITPARKSSKPTVDFVSGL